MICNVADYYANNFGLEQTFYSSGIGGGYPNDLKVTCAFYHCLDVFMMHWQT